MYTVLDIYLIDSPPQCLTSFRYPQRVEYTSDRMLKMQVIAWPGKTKNVNINPADYAIRKTSKRKFMPMFL